MTPAADVQAVVGIRVDAATDIGSGHLMRCLGLAEALRARGIAAHFLAADRPGAQLERVVERGYQLTVLPCPLQPAVSASPIATPASQEADAQASVAAAISGRWQAMIVDHYALDAHWERIVKSADLRLLVVDDLADREHEADLVLDATYPGDPDRYRGLAGGAELLLGPAYALMSPAFALERRLVEERVGSKSRTAAEPRLLCFFGGSDLPDLSGQALAALREPGLADVPVDLVIGSANPHADRLREGAAARGRVRVHEGLPNLAGLMAQCSWAVGAGGVTAWERLCLGLPSAVVSIAENQVEACERLADAGLIDYVGHLEGTAAGAAIDAREGVARKLADHLLRMRAELGRARARVQWGMGLVDGRGTQRAVQALIPSRRDDLVLRPAALSDMATYFRWANDPDVRRQAWSQEAISWDRHVAWFQARMGDAGTSSVMLVLEADGLPVGQVRFDRVGPGPVERAPSRGRVWQLDYSLEGFARGRGWAAVLLTDALAWLPRGDTATAEVRPGNAASIRALTSAGWDQVPGVGGDAVRFEIPVSS